MRSIVAVPHGPASIKARFVRVAVAVTLVAIAANVWMYLDGAAVETRGREAVDTALVLHESVMELRGALIDEHTSLTNYLQDAHATFIDSAVADRHTEVAAVGRIRTAGAGLPAVIQALDAADAAIRDWWVGFADPARERGVNGAPATPSVVTTAPDVITSADDAFVPVLASLDRLEASYAKPAALLAAVDAQNSQLRTAELAVTIATLVGAFAFSFLFACRWIFEPLAKLLRVATTLREGGSATFPASDSEIGKLGAELDRTYRTLAWDAQANGIVSRFEERVIMEEDDQGVVEGLVVALDELTAPDRITVHVSNRSRDRATLQACKGDVEETVVSLHGLERCPGVRRSVLYRTQDAEDRQTVICPLLPTTTGTLVHIPLIDRDCVGVVHLAWDAPGRLEERTVPTIHRLAEHAALSIANRRMVAGLQLSASTDARTGLLNSRAFDDLLERALREISGSESSALLMLDVDHFKEFNDRFGHAAGDEALRALASVLRGQIRDGDAVARYGGEEFVVFLPSVDATGAAEIAERIRRAVETTIIAVRPGETSRITVSVGVATAPGDGTDRTTLVKTADRMLYAAKEGGRNLVATTTSPSPTRGPESAAA